MPPLFETQRDILAAIAEFMAGRIDALRLAERVHPLASKLDPDHQDDDLTAFVAVHSETDRVLTQDSVRGWHESVRAERQQEYERAERFYRSDIEAAASSLMARWGPAA